ncbi:flagellar basal body rod protein FlgB [Anaeromyxobacter dehalogenans]|uniref:Flagellar basal body rod protein FlgB n=1 Tax=Anaeromyxobacter dehalogenans (strain 2CP-C) TaxID=290397 RepID=Q2IQT8_ANADE|nr:flagellar biosynthesis protein FlgB [Anaeromyxobacter dehalogenans]ABC81171.1 flagellar basal-body rod protein FlgB [Anaeromyxobacter dehalogenans 2CP-C]
MRIFDATLSTLERALDVRLARQTVLGGDLANANTPGFTPLDLDFRAAMAAAPAPGPDVPAAPPPRVAARRGDIPLTLAAAVAGAPQPIAGAAAPERFVAEVPGAAPGLDGNAVDLDRTTAAIAENAIQYGAAARAAAKKLAILRYVASDGAA